MCCTVWTFLVPWASFPSLAHDHMKWKPDFCLFIFSSSTGPLFLCVPWLLIGCRNGHWLPEGQGQKNKKGTLLHAIRGKNSCTWRILSLVYFTVHPRGQIFSHLQGTVSHFLAYKGAYKEMHGIFYKKWQPLGLFIMHHAPQRAHHHGFIHSPPPRAAIRAQHHIFSTTRCTIENTFTRFLWSLEHWDQ